MKRFAVIVFAFTLAGFLVAGGETRAASEPVSGDSSAALGAEHALMERLSGDFDLTSRYWLEPDGQPQTSRLPAHREMILGGRVMRLDVGPDADGFEGTGMMGYDQATGKFWYVWTDITGTGYSLLEGSLDSDGAGTLRGEMSSPGGHVPLTIEIRNEDGAEIHDYLIAGDDGAVWRFLELRYRPAATP